MENGTNFESELPNADTNIEGALSLAPGAERHHSMAQNGSAGVAGSSGIVPSGQVTLLNYSTDFPELPGAPPAPPAVKALGGTAYSKPLAIRAQVVTQVFQLQNDERSSKTNVGKSFGNTNDEQQRCNEIARASDTTIELCEAKDHTLTVLITGKRAKVEEARARLVKELQTQATREISIPKEHHRILIGKEGSKLHAMEQDTDCRIVVPGRDNPSDIIKIIGPREGIEKAVHEIQLASDKQSKLAQEHLNIARIYYPWIRGPNNETMDALMAETGAKINIPPPTANNQIIVVTGEKEGVRRAAEALLKIKEDKEANAKSVTCQVARAQHRYVIGPQRRCLAEILKETGISVEVPTEDEESDTLTLRGDASKLGEALAMVYAKASSVITSEITCENWMHKFLIGPKGSTLQTLVPNKDKVQIDFEAGGLIYMEGPPEEVKAAQTSLTNEIERLTREMTSDTMKVHPSLHRHVIGRGGTLISKIKEETGVQITIPNEQTNSDEIKVEGNKEGVKKAIAEISEIVKRIENEKSRDILIEQRFHKQIIGSKGEAISKLRDQYRSVVFSFPDASKKSDIVNLRGDKAEVDKVFKQLTALKYELLESNYQVTVPIFKEFHKHIIGKGGANVRKIREDTKTRIDLPGGDSGEDKITVTGKKANVDKAVEQLTHIQNELASIVVSEVIIPQKVHPRLLGGGYRLIHDIQEECGGVHIKFPLEKSSSDKVTIRGPKEDVAKAQKLLVALAKDCELSSFEDSIKAKPEFHSFLIGRAGNNIKKIREKHADVRILFPRDVDLDKETIILIGKKEEVALVKKELGVMITELNETVELKMDVHPKHHRHFIVRGAAMLREIQEQNGGVIISFPRATSQDSKVTIKGSKQCVESAKARIDEIVEDLEAQVTIQVEVPAHHHRALLSNRGQKIQDLCMKFNVQINFPDRRLREQTAEHKDMAASAEQGSPEQQSQELERSASPSPSTSPLNLIALSGRETKCAEAKEALLAMVPITKQVHVAYGHHRHLIGRSGETVRSLMQAHDVKISIPPEDKHLDEITLTGQAENVEEAVKDILERVGEFEEAAEDRKLRSYKLTCDIPREYHVRLIGPRGKVVSELRAKHEVQIAFPRNEEAPDTIIITGYEKSCHACEEEMQSMVGEARMLFTQEMTLDASVHPRIIGTRGRNLKKIMDDYHVEIRFPHGTDPDPNLVVVAGKTEDSVYDCIDYLRGEEEEYLQERNESGQYMSQRVAENAPKANQVKIEGAPWQLDMQSDGQFPTMGAVPAPAASSGPVGAWGGARRF